jgi:hypothetical protein
LFVCPEDAFVEPDPFDQNKRVFLPKFACVSIGRIADPDPGSGAFLTPGSGIRDGKKSGSWMNIPDHISESLEPVSRTKNT